MRGRWIAKSAVQKGISVLPGSTTLNSWFQRKVTKRADLTEDRLVNKTGAAQGHIEVARPHGVIREGFTALDLGGGWHPVVPLCLYLVGAERVYMVDLEDHLRSELVADTLRAIAERAENGRLDECLGRVPDAERVAAISDAAEVVAKLGTVAGLGRLGILPVIGDARDLPLEPVDLVVSTHTLEHIPYEVLVGILAELHRLTRPGGVMTHLVDLCDHSIYVDSTITVYNFLRFSERAWRIVDNSLQPLNRLRISAYRDAYRDAAVEITEEWSASGDLEELGQVELASPFSEMDPEMVAVKTARFTTVGREIGTYTGSGGAEEKR